MTSTVLLNEGLSTARPPPSSLSVHRIRDQGGGHETNDDDGNEDDGGEYYYEYDSTNKNGGSGESTPGRGVPCGALSETEVEDTLSFLNMLRPELAELARYLESIAGISSRDSDGTVAVAVSTSRIFRTKLASVELTVGHKPVIRFVHHGQQQRVGGTRGGRADNGLASVDGTTNGARQGQDLRQQQEQENSPNIVVTPEAVELQHRIDSDDSLPDTTSHVLAAFCSKLHFDPISGRAGYPQTLHRIASFPPPTQPSSSSLSSTPHSYATPFMVTLRMGRRNADQECKTIVDDLCNKLWGRRPPTTTCNMTTNHHQTTITTTTTAEASHTARSRSLLILGHPASGKTTMAREMAKTLSGFYKKSVVVMDTVGELAGCTAPSTNSTTSVDTPPHFCGDARCVYIPSSDDDEQQQHSVMVTAVESHAPDVLVLDNVKIQDARAIERVISRGVAVICTAHATDINDLLMMDEMRFLLGHIVTNCVTDVVAARIGSKTHTTRTRPSCFKMALILDKTSSFSQPSMTMTTTTSSSDSTNVVTPRYRVIPNLDAKIDRHLSSNYLHIAANTNPFAAVTGEFRVHLENSTRRRSQRHGERGRGPGRRRRRSMAARERRRVTGRRVRTTGTTGGPEVCRTPLRWEPPPRPPPLPTNIPSDYKSINDNSHSPSSIPNQRRTPRQQHDEMDWVEHNRQERTGRVRQIQRNRREQIMQRNRSMRAAAYQSSLSSPPPSSSLSRRRLERNRRGDDHDFNDRGNSNVLPDAVPSNPVESGA